MRSFQLEPEIETTLQTIGFAEVCSVQAVSGGDINEAFRLHNRAGETLFLKTHSHPPPGMFAAEARGLAALRAAFASTEREVSLHVPQVHGFGERFLLLEDLGTQARASDFAEHLGRGLARLHRCRGPAFGFFETNEQGQEIRLDNYCGLTAQPNPHTQCGVEFFAEHRLRYQARLAASQGFLDKADRKAIDALCARLPALIPEQPPSLIHGDLWSGNVCADPAGAPSLIDPAAHWGWAEAEIAMTRMFGGFPTRFYEAYVEAHPLAPGWEQRLDLYNLYHALNHVNLFGSSYLSRVRATVRQYT